MRPSRRAGDKRRRTSRLAGPGEMEPREFMNVLEDRICIDGRSIGALEMMQ